MSDGFAMSMAVRAPVERVWRALRDPAEIRRWHGWNEPGLDAEIQVIYVDHANESDDEPYTLVVDPMETFLLEPHEDETTLHLVRVPREQAGEWADHYDDITLGWVSFLHQLRFALESHPGEERRTLFWQGAGEPGDDLMAAGALPAPALGRWVTETPAGRRRAGARRAGVGVAGAGLQAGRIGRSLVPGDADDVRARRRPLGRGASEVDGVVPLGLPRRRRPGGVATGRIPRPLGERLVEQRPSRPEHQLGGLVT